MPTEGAGNISELNSAAPTATGPAGEGDDELRQLKTVLLASFPALDGLISNTGATGDPADTDPPDAATFSKLFADVRASLTSNSAVPEGAIVMWAGTEAQIPTGWVICDGLNGTPDLRGRFVLGGADSDTVYPTGSSGGNPWDSSLGFPALNTADGGDGTSNGSITIPDHVIAEANIPAHDHALFYNEAATNLGAGQQVQPNHAVARETTGGGDENIRYNIHSAVTSPATVAPTLGRSGVYGSGTVAPLTHPPQDITINGIEHSHGYIPRFYSLAYIQFKGV